MLMAKVLTTITPKASYSTQQGLRQTRMTFRKEKIKSLTYLVRSTPGEAKTFTSFATYCHQTSARMSLQSTSSLCLTSDHYLTSVRLPPGFLTTPPPAIAIVIVSLPSQSLLTTSRPTIRFRLGHLRLSTLLRSQSN